MSFSFNNFEFPHSHAAVKRGGGVKELHTLLWKARKQQARYASVAGTLEGEQIRQRQALEAATLRATGVKVRDDPTRIAKTLAKRRQKKRQSAKKWAERSEAAYRKSIDASPSKAVKDAGHRSTKTRASNPSSQSKQRRQQPVSGGKDERRRKGRPAAAATKKRASRGPFKARG